MELIVTIVDVLKVPSAEAAEALWKEKAEDPCPCGCAGKKVSFETALTLYFLWLWASIVRGLFQLPGDSSIGGVQFVEAGPAQLLHARMLPISLPCENCGLIRIYQYRKKRGHPKLCQSCCHLAEKTPFWCDGYHLPNFDIPQHAERCETAHGPILLTPTQIRKRERSAMLSSNPDKFFDRSSHRYICNRCLKAAIPLGNRLERVRKTEAEEAGHPKILMVKIRTRERLDSGYP